MIDDDPTPGARSQTGVVIEGIKHMITDGELRPGSRLPVEKELAAQLEVGEESQWAEEGARVERRHVRAVTLAGLEDAESRERADALPSVIRVTPPAGRRAPSRRGGAIRGAAGRA